MRQEFNNILSTPHFQVDFYRAAVPTNKVLFTFTEFSNRKLDGPGFGGKFALESGFDVIAIKSNYDDWYKTLPSNTFDLIEAALSETMERHSFRSVYGSSMGGYAAIMFAKRIKANVVLAISPQFDIAEIWDRRWAKAAKEHGPIPILQWDDVCLNCKYFVMYDPFNADKLHVEKLAEIIPSHLLCPITLPHAGHPAGYFASATNVLKIIGMSVLTDRQLPMFRNKIRSAGDAYPNYYFNFAGSCVKRQKLALAEHLINRAISKKPLNSEYRMRASQIAEAKGDMVEAIAHASIAIATAPKHPHMVATLSRLLQKTGMYAQALHYIDVALSLDPSVSFTKQRDTIVEVILRSPRFH